MRGCPPIKKERSRKRRYEKEREEERKREKGTSRRACMNPNSFRVAAAAGYPVYRVQISGPR